MKKLVILFLLFAAAVFAQSTDYKGTVVDAETGAPLANANIHIVNTGEGTVTDSHGNFLIRSSLQGDNLLEVSFLGYKSVLISLDSIKQAGSIKVFLYPEILPSQSVLVTGSIGTTGTTPLAFEKITRKQIENNYTVQDVPAYLSTLPSTTFYSEGGSGIGYNYISIRGFDQRRIAVSVNGIPQNEPEDQNVYWLDFPDLLASTELIQVQRGAGSGVFGYPAIGGSINIITSAFSNKPLANVSVSLGSYNTRKYSAAFSSGLLAGRYSFYAKISQILTSGYRNLSWDKFNSYHFSLVRYDNNITSQLNIYGGPVEDALAYTGLPKFAVTDKDLRKANYSAWNKDINYVNYIPNFITVVSKDKKDTVYAINRRPDEIENFSQPHFELLNEIKLNKNLTFNSALFFIRGSGFFDYDGSWSIFYDDYFRLKQNGFDTSYIPANALIRAQVENFQYGWIVRGNYSHSKGNLVFGIELRKHKSDHWGSIRYAENIPPGVTRDYRYYFYNGGKDIFSTFVHESYNISDNLNVLGELQLAYHKYRLHNERYVNNDFSVEGLFLNPRAGINYKLTPRHNIYLSYARVTKEPRLKNYYDAAESSQGLTAEIPLFNVNPDGSLNYNDPVVKPETMNDFELGTSYVSDDLSLSVNLFYMLFDDEIVKKGELDRFGQPVTGNIDRTIHAGIELSGNVHVNSNLDIFVNSTFSSNKIDKGLFYLSSSQFINLAGNRINGFPDFLANIGLTYNYGGLYIQAAGKYVGSFYSDNYDKKLNDYLVTYPGLVDYSDNKNPEYFTADVTISYRVSFLNALSDSKFILQVNNIFNRLYSAYAIGGEFFPAAERNFLAGIQLGL